MKRLGSFPRKRHRYLALVLVVFALSTLACFCGGLNVKTVRFGWPGAVRGSGRVAEEGRQVSGITGVELATFGDLSIEVGEREELRIEAEDNLIPYFETEMRNGTLVIKQRPNVRIVSRQPVNFYLTVKELKSIEITGSGNVSAPDLDAEGFRATIGGSGDLRMEDLEAGPVTVRINGSGGMRMKDVDAETLSVRITGSGDMDMGDLNADTLEVRLTGSGHLDIAGGQVDRQEITINGSGDYSAGNLSSSAADVQLTGSGSATIQVEERLNAALTGSGDVRYTGSPTVEESATGSGDAVHVGD
jgi:carbon monoxide dehydrogenase subunit G